MTNTGILRVRDSGGRRRQMPVTIAILINPGTVPPLSPNQQARFHRSHEYDAVTPRYARFLIEDMLPLIGKSYSLTQIGRAHV